MRARTEATESPRSAGVSTRGEFVHFDFMGKSHQRQRRELRHRRVARLVRELMRFPGEVFKYRDESGAMIDVRTPHINAYIKAIMGEAFSAKDFRTWAANLLCACALAKTPPAESLRERRRQITAAVRDVAGHLGNTPAVCRASYIFDVLLERHARGLPTRSYFASTEAITRGSARGLARSERALLALVRPGSSRACSRRRQRFCAAPRASSSRTDVRRWRPRSPTTSCSR